MRRWWTMGAHRQRSEWLGGRTRTGGVRRGATSIPVAEDDGSCGGPDVGSWGGAVVASTVRSGRPRRHRARRVGSPGRRLGGDRGVVAGTAGGARAERSRDRRDLRRELVATDVVGWRAGGT